MTDFISQVKTLAEAWPAKLAATAAGVAFSEFFQFHLHLLLLFALLEFVDCFSKWLALLFLALLTKTDYEAIKYAEGIITTDNFANLKTAREAWRTAINSIQACTTVDAVNAVTYSTDIPAVD